MSANPSAPDARRLPPAVERALAELSTVESGVESALNLLSGAQIGGMGARHSIERADRTLRVVRGALRRAREQFEAAPEAAPDDPAPGAAAEGKHP